MHNMAEAALAELAQAKADPWRNRILRHAEMPIADLRANPRNWRTHPQAQRDALSGVLRAVGLVQTVIFNERTGLLVDGHARVEEAAKAGQTTLPVSVVDLSDDEEALVLATLDPISAMAGANAPALDDVLKRVQTGDAALQAMLGELAEKSGLYFGDKQVQQDASADAGNYREQYGVIVVCHSEAEQEEVYGALNARYEEVRVVVT